MDARSVFNDLTKYLPPLVTVEESHVRRSSSSVKPAAVKRAFTCNENEPNKATQGKRWRLV